MATRPIRFQFLCDKVVEGLNFNHPVPESLVIPLSKIRQESSFADRFRHAVLPFMKEHEAACSPAFDPLCVSCGSPITTVLQTPMSYLHKVGDPHGTVNVPTSHSTSFVLIVPLRRFGSRTRLLAPNDPLREITMMLPRTHLAPKVCDINQDLVPCPA